MPQVNDDLRRNKIPWNPYGLRTLEVLGPNTTYANGLRRRMNVLPAEADAHRAAQQEDKAGTGAGPPKISGRTPGNLGQRTKNNLPVDAEISREAIQRVG